LRCKKDTLTDVELCLVECGDEGREVKEEETNFRNAFEEE